MSRWFTKTIVATALAIAWVAAAEADGPLFRFDGREYESDELSIKFQQILYRLNHEHYEKQQVFVDEALYELYLEREAKRRGIESSALAAELIKSPEVSDKEVQAFYEQKKAEIAQPLESVRDKIVAFLKDRSIREQKKAIISRIKKESGFKLLVAAPPLPPVEIDTSGFPSKGNESAPITVVEFADYQCGKCRRAAAIMSRIVEKYPDDVKVVLLDFPINRSGISKAVAEGGVCASAQDKFWPYHDRAFEQQGALNHQSPITIAEEVGLDVDAFKQCIGSRKAKVRVARGLRQARQLGLNSTPAVFVNGVPLNSHNLEGDLIKMIDRLLAKAKAKKESVASN